MLSPNRSQSSSGLSAVGGDPGTLPPGGCLSAGGWCSGTYGLLMPVSVFVRKGWKTKTQQKKRKRVIWVNGLETAIFIYFIISIRVHEYEREKNIFNKTSYSAVQESVAGTGGSTCSATGDGWQEERTNGTTATIEKPKRNDYKKIIIIKS